MRTHDADDALREHVRECLECTISDNGQDLYPCGIAHGMRQTHLKKLYLRRKVEDAAEFPTLKRS